MENLPAVCSVSVYCTSMTFCVEMSMMSRWSPISPSALMSVAGSQQMAHSFDPSSRAKSAIGWVMNASELPLVIVRRPSCIVNFTLLSIGSAFLRLITFVAVFSALTKCLFSIENLIAFSILMFLFKK